MLLASTHAMMTKGFASTIRSVAGGADVAGEFESFGGVDFFIDFLVGTRQFAGSRRLG